MVLTIIRSNQFSQADRNGFSGGFVYSMVLGNVWYNLEESHGIVNIYWPKAKKWRTICAVVLIAYKVGTLLDSRFYSICPVHAATLKVVVSGLACCGIFPLRFLMQIRCHLFGHIIQILGMSLIVIDAYPKLINVKEFSCESLFFGHLPVTWRFMLPWVYC